MKKTLATSVNFVKRNKKTLVLAAVTIPVIVAQGQHINALAEFLEEKDLLTEFYGPQED